jgi:hypothetical protein
LWVGSDISEEDVPPFAKLKCASSETGLILLACQEDGGHDIQGEGVKKGTQSKSEERNGQKWMNMVLIRSTVLYCHKCVE